MKNIDFELFLYILIFVFCIGAAIAAPTYLDQRKCNRISDGGTQAKYSLIDGCYVNVNNRWIPIDNWRGEHEQR